MHTIRLASSRGSGLCWVLYDEQYRLRKVRSPQSSIDMKLWVFYVSTPSRSTSFNSRVQDQLPQGLGSQPHNQNLAKNNQGKSGSYPFRVCWSYNRGKCDIGSRCRFAHKCSKCSGEHPVKTCRTKYMRKKPTTSYQLKTEAIVPFLACTAHHTRPSINRTL
jgi:hypothetical protein